MPPDKKQTMRQFREAVGIELKEPVDATGREWDIVVIQEGFSKNMGLGPDGQLYPRYYPREVVESVAEMIDGLPVFTYGVQPQELDHIPSAAKRGKRFSFVDNRIGWVESPRVIDLDRDGRQVKAVAARFVFDDGAAQLRESVLGAWKHGKKDYVGFSLDQYGHSYIGSVDGRAAEVVFDIAQAQSVDMVADPAAGGQLVRLAASVGIDVTKEGGQVDKLKALLAKLVAAVAPDLLEGKDVEGISGEEMGTLFETTIAKLSGDQFAEKALKLQLEGVRELIRLERYDDAAGAVGEVLGEKREPVQAASSGSDPEPKQDPEPEQKKEPVAVGSAEPAAVSALAESVRKIEQRVRLADCADTLRRELDSSKLPDMTKTKIAASFRDRIFEPKELKESIQVERAYLAKLSGTGQIRVPGQPIEMRESSTDKWGLALDGFFAGEDLKAEDGKKVPRFRSFREAYTKIMGEPLVTAAQVLQESHCYVPSFMQRERPRAAQYLESLQTSDWAQVLGDSVARRMVAEFARTGLQSWRRIVSDVSSITDFRTQHRMQVGGYGDLPVVAEQGTYQPLTSPTDAETTFALAKRGGTEDLTEEMIANDDVGAIRRMPRSMGRAAARTLDKQVWAILTDNTATSYDGTVLFHANHSNLGSTALSSAELTVVKIAMRDQTPYGISAEPLGVVNVPKLLIVPNELEDLAFRLTSSDKHVFTAAAETATTPNPHQGMEALVVDYFTDANNYYVASDPMDVPMLEVGFYNGQEEPEVFVQNDPNSGSRFSADKVTYKVRFIYGVGLLGHEGLYAELVA